MTGDPPLLEVRDLSVEFSTDRGIVKAVNGLDYTIESGETLGFVGESGAGKTVTGLSVLDLIESPGNIVEGEIRFRGNDVLSMSREELRAFRGSEISIVFQDSMTALNPAYTIGTQIADVIIEHQDVSREEAREQTVDLLDSVQIPNPGERLDEYPHQFSGGMRQRALIAMALSCNPSLVIADEITTALDVTTEAEILDLLENLQEETGIAIQLITHDMGVIAEVCDRVGIMYAGELVEIGPVERIFNQPRFPYTVGLMNSLPQTKSPGEELEPIPGTMPDLIDMPKGCPYEPRCKHATEKCTQQEIFLEPTRLEGDEHMSACLRMDEIDWGKISIVDSDEGDTRAERPRVPHRESGESLLEVDGLKKYFDDESQTWLDRFIGERKYVHAVDDVSFEIGEGETLGLVGESGCGKTTLGRTVTQLYEPDEGNVVFAGQELTELGRRHLRESRSDFQVIFQDPFSSLNPRRTVENIIGRPMEIHGKVSSKEERQEKVKELLVDVGLQESHLDRYAHEFSGGQKQRIGIARALAVDPDLIVCDEPVSALDVSVQAKILNLLQELQDERDLTYLFIAHNLSVVRHISDRIAVMYLGEIVELGSTEQVFTPPYHPYTEILLSSIPVPRPSMEKERKKVEGEMPSPTDPPSGCRFHTRCPYAMPECAETDPKSIENEPGHSIDCHLFDREMMKDKDTDLDNILAQQRVTAEGITGVVTDPGSQPTEQESD